jgi:hypothetical protein
VLGQSGECPNQNPQGEGLFLSESKRKRDGCRSLAVWEGERRAIDISPRVVGPTCARHAWTVRDALADSPQGARTVRHPGADGPLFAPERPAPPLLPTNRADDPRRPGGRSARNGRIVQPTTADSPTSLFNFILIYSEIKI